MREAEAATGGQQVIVRDVATGREIDEAFGSIAHEKADALFVAPAHFSTRGAFSLPSWRRVTGFQPFMRRVPMLKPAA